MAAAQHMLPVFGVRALGIVEEEIIIMPRLEIALAVLGALLSWRRRRSGIRSRLSRRNGGMEFSLLIGPVANAVVVKLLALFEAVEGVAAVEFMLFVVGDGMGEGPARCRAWP